MDTIYTYLATDITTGRKKGTGYVCIRMDRPDKNAPGMKEYTCTFAFCSPCDKFNRVIARQITNSRATNQRIHQKIKVMASDYRSAINQIILSLEAHSPTFTNSGIEVPEWLRGRKLRPLREKKPDASATERNRTASQAV